MSDGVAEVFGAWRARQASPKRTRLTEDRKELIEKRMARGFSAEDLILLVEYAYEADTAEARFWRGEGSDGRQYLGLDNLLRISKLSDRLDRARTWKSGGGGEPEPDDPEDGIIFSGIGALPAGWPMKDAMTDRERLILTVATAVYPGTPLGPSRDVGYLDMNGRGSTDAPRWEHVYSGASPVPGDIVWALSSGQFKPHAWKFARWIEPLPGGDGGLVRELGGKRTCRISNEMFLVLRGVASWRLLEGVQHRMLEQVRGAFWSFDRTKGRNRFRCVFAGLSFDSPSSRTARVEGRPHAFAGGHDRRFVVDFEIGRRPPSQRAIADTIWSVCPWE